MNYLFCSFAIFFYLVISASSCKTSETSSVKDTYIHDCRAEGCADGYHCTGSSGAIEVPYHCEDDYGHGGNIRDCRTEGCADGYHCTGSSGAIEVPYHCEDDYGHGGNIHDCRTKGCAEGYYCTGSSGAVEIPYHCDKIY